MEVLFSQRQKVVLTLAIRSVMLCYFVQLRIAKVKQTTTNGIDSTCKRNFGIFYICFCKLYY